MTDGIYKESLNPSSEEKSAREKEPAAAIKLNLWRLIESLQVSKTWKVSLICTLSGCPSVGPTSGRTPAHTL